MRRGVPPTSGTLAACVLPLRRPRAHFILRSVAGRWLYAGCAHDSNATFLMMLMPCAPLLHLYAMPRLTLSCLGFGIGNRVRTWIRNPSIEKQANQKNSA